MKSIIFIFIIILLFCATPSVSWGITIHLDYEQSFDDLFDVNGEWYGVSDTEVKAGIKTIVEDHFQDWDIDVSELSGNISVKIGDTWEDGYGDAVTGEGSYFYDAGFYARVFSGSFAANPAWQGANATVGRIAKGMAGTISHEVGHLLNLFHAFVFDKYNPYFEGAVDGNRFPCELDFMNQDTLNYLIQHSADAKTRLMAISGYISDNERATEDREFSDYSEKSLKFAFNGGGTVDHTLVWGLRHYDTSTYGYPFHVTTDISISSGDSLMLTKSANLSFDTGKKIDVYGMLDTYFDVKLTREGPTGLWGYLSVKTGGVLKMLSNIIIEHGNGILLDGMISCAINPALVSEISGCQGGIWIYDGSPTIKHMIIKNCTSSYAVCSTGSGTHPTIEHVRIDTIPTYGIYQTNGGDVTMEDSAITGTSSDCIKIMTSTCGLNINNGENDFFPVGIKAIANQSGVDIYATDNHWGVDPVGSELFTYPADVVWSAEDAPQPYNHAPGSSKPAVLSAGNSFVDIYETLKSGNRELALEQYYAMVASNTDLITRKAAIKRIIQVNRDYGLAHDRVLRVIDEELKTPVGWYGANLEYLRAMIDVYDGRYADALEKLDAIANGYAGTPYEAEALSRMAVIYGDCYMDRDAALTYADKAAAVNPGQPELLIAYHAADKHYEPWNHTDVFKEWSGEIAKRPERDEDESVALTSPSVSISPNPANPSTTIHYTIAQPGNVSIAVYSVSGQKVATLVDGFLPAGTHAAVFDGSSLASGVYLYRFEAKGFAKTGKIVLVK